MIKELRLWIATPFFGFGFFFLALSNYISGVHIVISKKEDE